MTSDADRIAIADSYLQALLSRDGASVAFHPNAVRKEAGMRTGFSGRHLTRSLTSGLQYRLVKGISDKKWSVDGDNVTTLGGNEPPHGISINGYRLATVKGIVGYGSPR